jgi:5-methylcytosine-specific restriction endonuclease McrA
MRDGRLNYCVECIREKDRARRAKKSEDPAFRERERERSRVYREKNPERRAQTVRVYREQNREACIARTRAWQEANREHVNQTVRKRRSENPEQSRANWKRWNRVRKARIRGAEIREAVDPAIVWARDNGKCHICGKRADPDDWHLDHLVPVSLGGDHSYANVAVSHPLCNMRKGNRSANDQLRLM